MDTSSIESLQDQQKQLKKQMYDNLIKQINANIADLKDLSIDFTSDLVGKDGRTVCKEPLKIILFQTSLLTNNKVDVYVELSAGTFNFDDYDSEIGGFLPNQVSQEQLEILLSVSDHYEQAMIATDPDQIIKNTEVSMRKSNNDLQAKINQFAKK